MKIQQVVLLYPNHEQVIIDGEILKCCNFYGVTSTFSFVEKSCELMEIKSCTNFVLSFDHDVKHIHYSKLDPQNPHKPKVQVESEDGLSRFAFGTDILYALVVFDDLSELLIQVPNNDTGGTVDIKINTNNVYMCCQLIDDRDDF